MKFVGRIHQGDQGLDELIRRVEDFAEIGKAFDEPVKTYSNGMRARVAFGMSLAFEFDVYLSDEATAVGDQIFKQKAIKAFKERIGRSSLIIVSHAESIIKELCQAGIWLNEGGAQWYDDVNDALSDYHEHSSLNQEASQ